MEKYYLAIFAIVAVVGGILLITNSMNLVETGMASGINVPTTPFVGPPIIGESPINIIGGSARDLQYRACMGFCITDYNGCNIKADRYWTECMSKAPTEVCEPIKAKAGLYCHKDRSSCESRCNRLFK